MMSRGVVCRIMWLSIVVSELLDPQVDVACAINVLNLLCGLFIVPDIHLIINRVANSINFTVEAFFDLLLCLN